jgi:hypothetical protein
MKGFTASELFFWIETRSAPSSLAATLTALPSISEIPFLDSWLQDKLQETTTVQRRRFVAVPGTL